MRIKPVLLSLSLVAALCASAAQAIPLITNGNFELTTNGGNKRLAAGTSTTAADRTTLVGWTSSNGNDGGYNFVLNGSTATTTASALGLRGTGNGYTASPTGGNFFASDPLYYPGTLSQTVTGLTVGNLYTLSFDYALAQQTGYSGANLNDYWQVGFGSAIQSTAMLSIPDGGFSGWKTATMSFTAASTSQVLSFLAKGSATGAPPFLLLDNVSMQASSAVPEPATWSLMLGGLGLLCLLARRRRNQQA